MDELFGYLERLEVMIFFAGYPIIFSLVYFLEGEFRKKPKPLITVLKNLLPCAYALSGTLCFGFYLKKIYTGYTMGISISALNHPYLIAWGLFSMVFWFRFARVKPLLSLLHSLVFFFYIPMDLYLYLTHSAEKDLVKNDMNILTSSVLLNTSTLLAVLIFHFAWQYFRKK